ncbi:hypothetical protein ACIQ4I_10375 [Rummeliibacillus sp. NPDC094406]|uniref:hypothetical protein n=1 Tax=Rummeliibacillus sp. NPDC094406 TaxID=3364511 RepID=UPI0037F9BAF5
MIKQFEKLEEVINKIKEDVYYEVEDFPTGKGFNPKITPDNIEELRGQLDEMNEVLKSELIDEILEITEDSSPIEELSSFNFDDFKLKHFENDEMTVDVDERDSLAQEAASEEESRLEDDAREDVKELVDNLLPKLLSK